MRSGQRAHVPLARDDNGLTGAVPAHGSVRVLSDGEQVGFEFTPSPAIVGLNDFWAVQGDALEGIDGNEDDTGICIDAMLGVTIADGVKDYMGTFRVRSTLGRAETTTPT